MRITKFGRFSYLKALLIAGISASLCYAGCANATTDTIGNIATNVVGSFQQLTQLITAIAYIAGIGFIVAAIFKFKAHKDNPTQVPIGTPIVMLLVGAGLLFLPTVLGVAGQTVFETTTTVGPSGTTTAPV
jgi:intracellular multiplication protein IcmD